MLTDVKNKTLRIFRGENITKYFIMSHTDSTDDTDLSPLGSEAKHELLEIIRTRISQITRMSPMGS